MDRQKGRREREKERKYNQQKSTKWQKIKMNQRCQNEYFVHIQLQIYHTKFNLSISLVLLRSYLMRCYPGSFAYAKEYHRWLPQLRGFVCAYHPAASGSNPKHTIYAFSICIEVNEKRTKINKKRPGLAYKKRVPCLPRVPNQVLTTQVSCRPSKCFQGLRKGDVTFDQRKGQTHTDYLDVNICTKCKKNSVVFCNFCECNKNGKSLFDIQFQSTQQQELK